MEYRNPKIPKRICRFKLLRRPVGRDWNYCQTILTVEKRLYTHLCRAYGPFCQVLEGCWAETTGRTMLQVPRGACAKSDTINSASNEQWLQENTYNPCDVESPIGNKELGLEP